LYGHVSKLVERINEGKNILYNQKKQTKRSIHSDKTDKIIPDNKKVIYMLIDKAILIFG
jgi:hypothetical protein